MISVQYSYRTRPVTLIELIHQLLFSICITLLVESAPFIPSTSFCSLSSWLLVHLILHISPHHSHHYRSHHLSLPRPFTPDLKLINFTNPSFHSLSGSWTVFTDFGLGPYLLGTGVCSILSSFPSTFNSLYRIISYRIHGGVGSLVGIVQEYFFDVFFQNLKFLKCRVKKRKNV